MDLLTAVFCLLPASRLKNALLSLLGRGFEIDRTAHFGPSIVWRVKVFRLGQGSRVGFGNTFRDMRRVELADGAVIGQLNWFSGSLQWIDVSRSPHPATLAMGARSTINARHYIDCSGGFSMGVMSRLAGNRSTVFTHLIDPELDAMITRPVAVEHLSYVNTNVVLTPGAHVGPKIVVAAGAVVSGKLEDPESLYGGVPARRIRSLEGAALFRREDPVFTAPSRVQAFKRL